jgi:hypothetical protein
MPRAHNLVVTSRTLYPLSHGCSEETLSCVKIHADSEEKQRAAHGRSIPPERELDVTLPLLLFEGLSVEDARGYRTTLSHGGSRWKRA